MADDTDSEPLSESYEGAGAGDGRTTRTRRGVLTLILLALISGLLWLFDRFLPSGYGTGRHGGGGFGE